MDEMFSDRIKDVPKSFIREILKVSINPSVISFAGGLPNRELFPDTELQEATQKVFASCGKSLLQYSNSEGLIELREWIARRYKERKNIDVSPDTILITNGGQQGLDLLGKTLINAGDGVVIEEPGYLGAIQSFSIYQPKYFPVSVHDTGMDLDQLGNMRFDRSVKLMYTVPNFQNPSGITYTEDNRKAVMNCAEENDFFVIEDDPYGELRFMGKEEPSFYSMNPEKTVMLGSFSKIVAPGLRLGWIVAPEKLNQKLLVAKQASDLHTCNFTQSILHRFLCDYDLDKHISKIRRAYGAQCQAMLNSIEETFPSEVSYTRPEGGMFLWGRLPDGMSSMALFDEAVKQDVVFVPGDPFYTTIKTRSDFRLNFSCVDEKTAEEGIKRLAAAIKKMM